MDFREQYFRVNEGDVLVFDKAFASAYISTDDKDKVDFSKANTYKLLLKGNITFPIPGEIINGQNWTFLVQQNSVGGHTITFPESYVVLNNNALDKNPNAKSLLTIRALDGKLYVTIDSAGTSPSTGVVLNPAEGIDLSNPLGVYYNSLTQSGALELSIKSNSIVGGEALLPITLDGNTITITGATKQSGDAGTSGTVDKYLFWKDTTGIYYVIINQPA